MNLYIKNKEEELKKTIEFFKKELGHLRTGRSNPNMLEGITAEVYGVRTPLNGLANITVADGHSMTVSPWDKKIIKDIEKAIIDANLGLGVVNEGDRIRLTIPQMTEENRRELVKKLNEKMEDCRIANRQTRDTIKTEIEKAEKDKVISEDDRFRFIKELDETVGGFNDELKELRDKKEKEIMTI
jgi:ribosome recycling factor